MVLILLSSVSPNIPTPTSVSSLSPRSPSNASSPSSFFAILSPIFTADDAPASPASVNHSATPSPRIVSPGNIPPITPPPWLIGPRSPTSPLRPAPLRMGSETRVEKRLPALPGMLGTPTGISPAMKTTSLLGRPPSLRDAPFSSGPGTPRSLFSRERGDNPPSAHPGVQPRTRPGPNGGFKRTRTEPLSSMNLQVHQKQQQQALPRLPSPSLETSVSPPTKIDVPTSPSARPAPPARAQTFAAASVPRLAINGVPSHESHPSEPSDDVDEDMESPTTPKASAMLPTPDQEEARRLSMAVMGVDVGGAEAAGLFSASALPKAPSTPKPQPEPVAAAATVAAAREPEVMEVPLAIDTRPSRTPSPAAPSFASPPRARRSESLQPGLPAPTSSPRSSPSPVPSPSSSPSPSPSPRKSEHEYVERRAKRRSVFGLEGLAASRPTSSLGSPASLGSVRSARSGSWGSVGDGPRAGPLGRLARVVGR